MDAPQRGALTLVRLIGVLLVVWTLLELALYWGECSNPKHPMQMQMVPVLVKSIPSLLGLVILMKARAIAEWISNTLDL